VISRLVVGHQINGVIVKSSPGSTFIHHVWFIGDTAVRKITSPPSVCPSVPESARRGETISGKQSTAATSSGKREWRATTSQNDGQTGPPAVTDKHTCHSLHAILPLTSIFTFGHLHSVRGSPNSAHLSVHRSAKNYRHRSLYKYHAQHLSTQASMTALKWLDSDVCWRHLFEIILKNAVSWISLIFRDPDYMYIIYKYAHFLKPGFHYPSFTCYLHYMYLK